MDHNFNAQNNKRESYFPILMACFIGINVTSFISLLIVCYRRFVFPYYEMESAKILLFAMALLPTFFAVVGYFVHRITKGKVRSVMSTISIVIIAIAMVPAFLAHGLLNYVNLWSSQTNNGLNHYLLVDVWVRDYDFSFIPEKVPESASDVEYFYRCRYPLDLDFDIYVEWKLSDQEYIEEKQKLMAEYDSSDLIYLDDIIEMRIEYRVYYSSSYVKAILFFEDTKRIAYTFSYAQDNGNGSTKPYYVDKYPELAVNFKRL